jgi:hypothetical protein
MTLREVVAMSKIKPLKETSFTKRLLRALGVASSLEMPSVSQEEKCPGVSAYTTHYDFHKGLESAKMEADQTKAKTIMEYQFRNTIR